MKKSFPKSHIDKHLADYLKYTYIERIMWLTKVNDMVRKKIIPKRSAMRMSPKRKLELLEEVRKNR